jgi:FtsH-binding integral membrane protein
MADIKDFQTRTASVAGVRTDAGVDQGLRSYMLKVYNLMALGVALTGLVAYFVADLAISNGQLTGFGQAIYLSPLRWVVIFAPLALVFFLSFRLHAMSEAAAQITYWIYAALVGASLSTVFVVYTGASIVQTFAVTAASFGALSLYGYTTKRDLSAMGSFLVMGLFGLIIASLVNFFLQSSALQFAVSVIGVLVFAGLTAWDTQQIKEMYLEDDSAETTGKKAIMGALSLYMDFINLFLFLLRFLGNRE